MAKMPRNVRNKCLLCYNLFGYVMTPQCKAGEAVGSENGETCVKFDPIVYDPDEKKKMMIDAQEFITRLYKSIKSDPRLTPLYFDNVHDIINEMVKEEPWKSTRKR